MLYQWIRVIKSNNGVLTDLSLDNQDESSQLLLDLDTSDYLYIGQHFPFNNFFIQIDTANDEAAVMSIEYWAQQDWKTALDVLDGTTSSGKTFARSGVVQFSPNSQYRWDKTADSTQGSFPTELEILNIYSMYWLRIKVNNALNVLTKIQRVAYAFTSHQQIDNLDTTINEYLTDFKAGKTTWEDEIVTASITLVGDLRLKGLVVGQGEILRFDDVSMTCDWGTLKLIYRNLGGDYKEKLSEAKDEYNRLLSIGRFAHDKNSDGRLDDSEIKISQVEILR